MEAAGGKQKLLEIKTLNETKKKKRKKIRNSRDI